MSNNCSPLEAPGTSAGVALWQGARIGEETKWPLVPIWFFALGMAVNGVAHPLLALQAGGYFPGLVSSPVVGGFGVMLWSRLLEVTEKPDYPIPPLEETIRPR